MLKTRSFKRVLAILLSVLLATPLFVLSAFADGDGDFNILQTDTSKCETGDTWYNLEALADATGVSDYLDGAVYLSEDGNTLRFTYRGADDQSVTEEYDRETGPAYFDYICVLPAFGDPLPTSDEGLDEGDYWYDLAGLVSLLSAVGINDQTLNLISAATFRLSVDGEILRMTTKDEESSAFSHQDEFTAEPDVLCGFLLQVGAAPVEYDGFTLLPKSEVGLADGELWFNADGLASVTGETYLANATYYLSDDGDTLRIVVAGSYMDITREDEPSIFTFIRQVGVDPNAGFTLLPTSDEGLEDGDWWFDAAAFADEEGESDFLDYQYYLSDDGTKLRVVSDDFDLTVSQDDDDGKYLFGFLRQVGVDPDLIPGFTLLPFSDEGLEDGDYWYDAASFADMFEDDGYLSYQYYLSDDGTTLRVKNGGYTFDLTEDDSATYFRFLRRVGVDPYPGYILLPKSDEGLSDGDYWFDAVGFAALTNSSSAQHAEYLLSEDGTTLRITETGYTFDIHKCAGGSGPYFAYLRTAGEVYTILPTSDEDLEEGDWWYDAAALAEAMEDDAYLTATYSLSENGETLCIVNGDSTTYYQNDAGYAQYFLYLYQVGAAGFELLPTSADDLGFGAYWYDAAGLAALEEDESLLGAEYYYNAETGVLRIVIEGYPIAFSPDDDGAKEVLQFLEQVTVDPETGVAFMRLPLSDEGLQDGDYWFDAASVSALSDYYGNLLATYPLYLSEDATTLRMVIDDYCEDLSIDDGEEGYAAFYYVRQVGVDPNAGYTLLPIAPDGLNVGDWWFDAASLAAEEENDEFLTYSYYLSEDGSELRIIAGGLPIRILADDPDMADVMAFLHQVGDDKAVLTLSAPTGPVYRGQTFTVTVDLTQNPGLAGMTLSLDYDDSALTLTDVQTSGMLDTGNLTLGGDLNAQPYNILWDDATSHDIHTETGTILTLTFTVKNTAAGGETTVTLTYDEESVFDIDLQSVPMVVYGAAVMIDARMPGDADNDGEVDLADVAALTRYLAGGWDVTINEENCDVNGDDEIDLKDVILIRRFLAGGWGVKLV